MIACSYYLAYHLTEPMFWRDGTTPSIDFLALSLPQLIGPGLFPLTGIFCAIIPAALSFAVIRYTARLSVLRSALLMQMLLIGCLATVYIFIPFSIASGVALGSLSAVATVVTTFRRAVINPNLPPDRKGPASIRSMERARKRWQWLLRQTIWWSVTILVAQVFQSVLSFQSLLSTAIPPPEVTPYPLDFFRYQIVITFATFAYCVAGVLLFATIFCYNKMIRVEEQELTLETIKKTRRT